MSQLFQNEDRILEDFQKKIDDKNFTNEDVIDFKKKFENLAYESQVMLKISDRLQKRLDMANTKVREKNEEIVLKNTKLNEALDNLMKAQIGKKASTIMFTATILMFVSEELYIEPFVEYFVNFSYLILIMKGFVALGLKSFEGVLESFFINREKKAIVNQAREATSEKKEDVTYKPALSQQISTN